MSERKEAYNLSSTGAVSVRIMTNANQSGVARDNKARLDWRWKYRLTMPMRRKEELLPALYLVGAGSLLTLLGSAVGAGNVGGILIADIGFCVALAGLWWLCWLGTRGIARCLLAFITVCPYCEKRIPYDVSWVCPRCPEDRNTQTWKYSFLNECQFCHGKPAAYECPRCHNLIVLISEQSPLKNVVGSAHSWNEPMPTAGETQEEMRTRLEQEADENTNRERERHVDEIVWQTRMDTVLAERLAAERKRLQAESLRNMAKPKTPAEKKAEELEEETARQQVVADWERKARAQVDQDETLSATEKERKCDLINHTVLRHS
jgi:hypothetical protein